jgi:hypothetical protein
MNSREQTERALALLAMPSAEQAHYLIELGTYPILDELALEFDDAYRFFESQVDQDEVSGISKEARRGLAEIDLALDELSDQKDSFSWEAECLDDPRWEAIRQKAKCVLEALVNSPSEKLKAAIKGLKAHWAGQERMVSRTTIGSRCGWVLPGAGVLPPDFQALYCAVDGMSGFYTYESDREGFQWHPLSGIYPVQIKRDATRPDTATTVYVFMNYQHQTWWYGFRDLADGGYEIGVLPTQETWHPITLSLEDFIALYLADADALYPVGRAQAKRIEAPDNTGLYPPALHLLDREGKELLARRILGEDWTEHCLVHFYGEDPDDETNYMIETQYKGGILLMENGLEQQIAISLLIEFGAPIRTHGLPRHMRLARWWKALWGRG